VKMDMVLDQQLEQVKGLVWVPLMELVWEHELGLQLGDK